MNSMRFGPVRSSAAGPLRIEGLDRDTALRLVDDLTRKADLVAGDAT